MCSMNAIRRHGQIKIINKTVLGWVRKTHSRFETRSDMNELTQQQLPVGVILGGNPTTIEGQTVEIQVAEKSG